MYRVFSRTWWKPNPTWPDGREPAPSQKRTIAEDVPTAEEARAMCLEWNESHDPGPMSRKAEFEQQ